MKIYKQYVFVCTFGSTGFVMGNCMNCSGRAVTVQADTIEAAKAKFKKLGGKIDEENDKIIPPSIYCSLMGLDEEVYDE